MVCRTLGGWIAFTKPIITFLVSCFFFFLIDYVFKLFIFFSIDLEIMQPCRGNFIASLTLNNCSRQKEIMMKGLVENNTRHSGTDTNEG